MCIFKSSTLGVSFYVVFNTVWELLSHFIELKSNIYMNVFEAGTMSLILALSIGYFINNELKFKNE